MDKLMQSLFDYNIGYLLEMYYPQTNVHAHWEIRDTIGRKLWEKLPLEQRKELEALQRAYDRAQMAELEAMFLASFDQALALHQPHCTQPTVPSSPLQGVPG